MRLTPCVAAALTAQRQVSSLAAIEAPAGEALPSVLPPRARDAESTRDEWPLVRFASRNGDIDVPASSVRGVLRPPYGDAVAAAVAEWAELVGERVARHCVVSVPI